MFITRPSWISAKGVATTGRVSSYDLRFPSLTAREFDFNGHAGRPRRARRQDLKGLDMRKKTDNAMTYGLRGRKCHCRFGGPWGGSPLLSRTESEDGVGNRFETGETANRLRTQYAAVRQTTEELARPLSPEDCQIQSMPDASPTKWHLAHTSWFFETFVLTAHAAASRRFIRHSTSSSTRTITP